MKPNPICITKQKLLFENEGERERERDIEKKGTSEIPYTNLCCVFLLCFMLLSLSVPLSFVLSMSLLCVYLLSFSVSAFFFSSLRPLFFFACWRLFIYREVWETAPTFFRSSTDRLIGNIHGPLSFFTCSCHPSLFSLLVCFVSRIFFS